MANEPDYLDETPSQTAGPYIHIGTVPNFLGIEGVYAEDLGARMIDDQTRGERITITGRVLDGVGAPLRDAIVEIWQPDAAGLFPSPEERRGTADPHFAGWGRSACDLDTGLFRFETIRPGRVPLPDGRLQAPHVNFWIAARGVNVALHTRMYFPDEEAANAEDPILARLMAEGRGDTLVAKKAEGGFHFEIRLQGHGETVFFDL